MKFILWFLVFWGIVEIEHWREYKYLGREYIKENSGLVAFNFFIELVLFFYLYQYYIK